MVRANGGGYAAVLFFPDEPELVRAVRAAAAGEPECAVVSPGAFEQMLADDFGGRFLKVLAAAAAGVLALAAFFFRSAALTFLAAVPAVTAMAVLGAVFALCGTALNLIVCFTGIMLAGLTIDYGIFAVYAAKGGTRFDAAGGDGDFGGYHGVRRGGAAVFVAPGAVPYRLCAGGRGVRRVCGRAAGGSGAVDAFQAARLGGRGAAGGGAAGRVPQRCV